MTPPPAGGSTPPSLRQSRSPGSFGLEGFRAFGLLGFGV